MFIAKVHQEQTAVKQEVVAAVINFKRNYPLNQASHITKPKFIYGGKNSAI